MALIPRSEIDHMMTWITHAGRQLEAGNPTGAQRTLRKLYAEADYPEIRQAIEAAALEAGLSVR